MAAAGLVWAGVRLVPARLAGPAFVLPGGSGLAGKINFASGCSPRRSAKATTKMAIPLRSMKSGSGADEFGNGIRPAATPGVTAAKTVRREGGAVNRAVAVDSLQGVSGAGRSETADRASEKGCPGR